MDVRWISPAGVEPYAETDLPQLIAREGGFVWVDIHHGDPRGPAVLSEVFQFHPLSVHECQEPVPLPKIHLHSDHSFVVLHGVEVGSDGRLHLIELDQFMGRRYLVTVHGRADEGLGPEIIGRETRSVLSRMESGRFRPKLPGELAHAVVIAMVRSLESVVTNLATRISSLEDEVMREEARMPEPVLEQMFQVRRQLLTLRTIATQSREVHARMLALARVAAPEATAWIEDQLDSFDRLHAICDGQKELLQDVLDSYQTRIANELNRFVKRLTSVGSILVTNTLIAGIYGMNFKNMPELDWKLGYPMALGLMAAVSLALVVFFRRRDWL